MSDALSSPVVNIHDLTFSYGSLSLFHQLSFTIDTGVTLILDESSSGKTTLLKLIAGELSPQAGTIRHANMATSTGNTIFWVDPLTDVFDNRVVKDYFDQLPQHYPDYDPLLLTQFIDAFSLAPHINKQFYMLSTGSKRKVWITAALASGARLVLLDNPDAALDGASIRFMYQYLAQQLHQSTQAIVITCYEIPNHLTDAKRVTLPYLIA